LLFPKEQRDVVAERKAADRLAALEEARAQLEIALGGDEGWLASRRAAGPDRLTQERLLADNPLHECWVLLEQAIADLRAKAAWPHEAEGCAAPDDLTRIRGLDRTLARGLAERGITRYGQIAAWRAHDVREIAVALGLGRRISRQNWIEQAALLEQRRGTGKTAASADRARPKAPGIELHQILEHIRSNAALGGDPPATARDRREAPVLATDAGSAAPPPPAASSDAPADGRAPAPPENREAPDAVESEFALDGTQRFLPEPEEATVTFVIRERVPAASADDGASDENAGQPLLHQPASMALGDAPQSPSAVGAEEAEVSIVTRPRDGARRSPHHRGNGR
jgi:hypothetical protein